MTVPKKASQGEGAVGGIDGHRDQAVGQGEPVVGVAGGGDRRHGRRGVGGRPRLPSEAGHVVGPDEHPPVGLVLDAHVDRVAPAGAGPGVEAGDGGGEGGVGDGRAGAGAQDHVEARLVVGHVDADDGAAPHRLVVGHLSEEDAELAAGDHPLGGRAGAGRDHLTALDVAGAGEDQFDQATPGAGGRVDDDRRLHRHRLAQSGEGAGGDRLRDLGGLGVAGEDGCDHVVGGTGADRVVGRVAHDLGPRQSEGRRVAVSREEGRQRFRQAFEGPFGPGRGLLDVDPVGGHAHEEVGPRPRPQLARPRRQPDDGRRGQVLGQRRDLEVVVVGEVVGLGHHPSEVGLEALVVTAVHPQEGSVGRQERPQLHLVGPDALDRALASSGTAAPLP